MLRRPPMSTSTDRLFPSTTLVRSVYASERFAWTQILESNWRLIRTELDQVMQRREQLPAFQQILDEVRTITDDDQWKTYWLLSAGMDCSENRRHCPQTTRLLKQIPGASTAFLSLLAPGKTIPPHRGAYNGILQIGRAHV